MLSGAWSLNFCALQMLAARATSVSAWRFSAKPSKLGRQRTDATTIEATGQGSRKHDGAAGVSLVVDAQLGVIAELLRLANAGYACSRKQLRYRDLVMLRRTRSPSAGWSNTMRL